jgi:pyruvate/2-oxoglutarate dehydrogenase complex dihydrolipoamide dehydrogenase (E3) component
VRSRGADIDLLVLGGGTAGLVAAHIAAGLGARVVLAERAPAPGGDCLWTGCVPSKSLLAAASLAQAMRTAPRVGLPATEPRIDFAAVMAHVHGARERIAPHDSAERLREAGVDVIAGEARFTGPRTAEAGGRALRFRRAFVATGSRPAIPPVPGLREAAPLTNETVWDLDALPGRLVVVGGGPIGCELGQAFARLGSAVTIVETGDRLLDKEEPRASALIAERLSAEGVRVRTGVRLAAVEGDRAVLEGGEALPFDRLLVATGRTPAIDGVGLDVAGVQTSDEGVRVDARLRTTNPAVYAGGDVTGLLPFTHVAAFHARVAVPNALFGARRTAGHAAVPWVTFTDPEVGRVGLTEAQARERWGGRVKVAESDVADLDRAITAGEAHGFAKLVGDPRGRLVGATVAAPAGGEAIAELAARVAQGGSIGDVSTAVHAYPTFAEGPARAADEHLRRTLLGPRTRMVARPALAVLRRLAAR